MNLLNSRSVRNINHLLCGCAMLVIQKSPFYYKVRLFELIYNEKKGDFMANKANGLSGGKWICKYHIIFTPKYRRKIIYNQYKESIRDIIK